MLCLIYRKKENIAVRPVHFRKLEGYVQVFGMKISIHAVVQNYRAQIGEAILRVQAQDYGNIEHINVYGVIHEGTLGIFQSLANSSTNVLSRAGSGIYNAPNTITHLATDDEIRILHSVDLFYDSGKVICRAHSLQDFKWDACNAEILYV